MRIVKLSSEQFGGYQKGLNGYTIRTNSGVELVRECKVISDDGTRVAFCKPGGRIEPTYATRRKYGDDVALVKKHNVSLCL